MNEIPNCKNQIPNNLQHSNIEILNNMLIVIASRSVGNNWGAKQSRHQLIPIKSGDCFTPAHKACLMVRNDGRL